MDLFSYLHATLISNLKKAGINEHCTHYLLNKPINNKSIVIDLGANEGHFYSMLDDQYNCTCYAVEASPRLFSKLPQKNNATVFNYAINKSDGPVSFFLSDNSEANSLDQSIAGQWGYKGKTTVEGITFEKFVKKIGIGPLEVLKIDIEGAELDMLEDISPDRLSLISQITIEFHDFLYTDGDYSKRINAVVKKMKDNNFFVVRVSNPGWRSALFLNKKLNHFNLAQKLRLNINHCIFHKLIAVHIFLGNIKKKLR